MLMIRRNDGVRLVGNDPLQAIAQRKSRSMIFCSRTGSQTGSQNGSQNGSEPNQATGSQSLP